MSQTVADPEICPMGPHDSRNLQRGTLGGHSGPPDRLLKNYMLGYLYYCQL